MPETQERKRCVACIINDATDEQFCVVCKKDSDKVRETIAHYIVRYERTFNIPFELPFDEADEMTIDTIPVARIDAALDNDIPVYVDEADIETCIDDDGCIHYKSLTADTDECIQELIAEISETRANLQKDR
jgi:hypothetical protein